MKNTAALDFTNDSAAGDTANPYDERSRRKFLQTQGLACLMTSMIAGWGVIWPSHAAVGTLPEFSTTNAILQGMTIQVVDPAQADAMVGFLRDGFMFNVLRKRQRGSVTETWMGYGPEQLSIPTDFVLPVSSFAKYGGHASIRIVYDAQAKTALYRIGDAASPGNNVAFIQVAVPGYRISQLVKNGGVITDAYGLVNIISPAGVPFRGIVGIMPDPLMMIALNCDDIEASRAFFARLGFVEQDYPYSRPSRGTGPFEPPQPAGSFYVAPSPNCLGILLLPPQTRKKQRVTNNPVLSSLDVVYSPADDDDESSSFDSVREPSGIAITFQSAAKFTQEEQITR